MPNKARERIASHQGFGRKEGRLGDVGRGRVNSWLAVSRTCQHQADALVGSSFGEFVSLLSEFQVSELQTKNQMLQSIEEVLEGEGALKAERGKKPKPAKTARGRRRGEGNSPTWSKGGPIGRLTWCRAVLKGRTNCSSVFVRRFQVSGGFQR
jgi:hypothetical protein